MAYSINETHDAGLRCRVESAHYPETDFPIQNLPFGVFLPLSEDRPRVGVAIGDQILDLAGCCREGLLDGSAATAGEACMQATLNALMSLGPESWSALRLRVSRLLRADSPELSRRPGLARILLVPMDQASMLLPASIGDYTDFYASLYHATNLGSIFRPENPLLPNYKWVPVGYHGRSSSVVVSGSSIQRPSGQTHDGQSAAPDFGPSRALDYELEVGIFIGHGNSLGQPIPIGRAGEHAFGLNLINDWSARDIQRWEYQPLGPFLAKSFATTISPWVISTEALQPYRAPAFRRPEGDPEPLPYLCGAGEMESGAFDINLQVFLSSRRMRDQGIAPVRLSHSNFKDMYWTVAQMIAHQTSNGCNLRPGDLLGSGTVSGPVRESLGCLLELTRRGAEPVVLPGGEMRSFLQDGDEIILGGHCERQGFARIGFGECRGVIATGETGATI